MSKTLERPGSAKPSHSPVTTFCRGAGTKRSVRAVPSCLRWSTPTHTNSQRQAQDSMSWEVSKENFQPLKQGRRVLPASETSEEASPDAAAREAQRRYASLNSSSSELPQRVMC